MSNKFWVLQNIARFNIMVELCYFGKIPIHHIIWKNLIDTQKIIQFSSAILQEEFSLNSWFSLGSNTILPLCWSLWSVSSSGNKPIWLSIWSITHHSPGPSVSLGQWIRVRLVLLFFSLFPMFLFPGFFPLCFLWCRRGSSRLGLRLFAWGLFCFLVFCPNLCRLGLVWCCLFGGLYHSLSVIHLKQWSSH